MRRFLRLNARDQLRAFERMRTELAAGLAAPSKIDEQLAEREAALDAIEATAAALGRTRGCWPTAREFDAVNRGGPWSVSRVAAAWGRWNFALDALAGGRTRPTPAQRELRRKIAGKDSRYEDPITSLRRWLEEDDEVRNHDGYDEWARVTNEHAEDGEPLMPGSTVIRDKLVIPFTEAVRVAEGEIELPDARPSEEQANRTWTSGPHDFVTKVGIAHITGKTRPQVATLVHRHDFPKPVLVLGRGEAWLRGDVEAFAEGRPFPDRERDELRSAYLTARELAALRGVTPAALRQKTAATPPRTGQINGAAIWFRPDAERWLADHPSKATFRGD